MTRMPWSAADEEAQEFIERIERAADEVPYSRYAASEAEDFPNAFRFAQSKERHVRALRRTLSRAQAILAEWEEEARAVGLTLTLTGTPDQPSIEDRILAARAAVAAHDRILLTCDPENVTCLVVGLLHLLTDEDHPADVLAAAIEMWAWERKAEGDADTPPMSDHFVGLASEVMGHLLHGADRMNKGAAMALLHLATGEV